LNKVLAGPAGKMLDADGWGIYACIQVLFATLGLAAIITRIKGPSLHSAE
jgi:hypothetical protein